MDRKKIISAALDREHGAFTRGLNIGFFVGVLCSMAGMWFVFHQVA